MDFVVDKVSEDSFYINVLIGLPKQLEKFKKFGVTTTHLVRKSPVPHSEICAWEQKQSILLPEDLRNFYNSCNGFEYNWGFKFGNDRNEVSGSLRVNELENLQQIVGYESASDGASSAGTGKCRLKLGVASRLFELVKIDDTHKVVLVYLNSRYSPTIWVTAGPKEFYYLADDFTTYLRMSLAHIGIPCWQLLFTPAGVPQWIENIIRILAPHLLKTMGIHEPGHTFKERLIHIHDLPINRIDVGVFKCLPKLPSHVPLIIEKEKNRAPQVPPGKKRVDKLKILQRRK